MTVVEWVPDRDATWSEVVVTASALLMVASIVLVGESVSLPWALGAFVATGVAVGPVANSTSGERVGTWFRGIGERGRAAVIGVYAVAVVVLFAFVDVPEGPLSGVVVGSMLCLVAYSLVHVATSDGVDGWRHDE